MQQHAAAQAIDEDAGDMGSLRRQRGLLLHDRGQHQRLVDAVIGQIGGPLRPELGERLAHGLGHAIDHDHARLAPGIEIGLRQQPTFARAAQAAGRRPAPRPRPPAASPGRSYSLRARSRAGQGGAGDQHAHDLLRAHARRRTCTPRRARGGRWRRASPRATNRRQSATTPASWSSRPMSVVLAARVDDDGGVGAQRAGRMPRLVKQKPGAGRRGQQEQDEKEEDADEVPHQPLKEGRRRSGWRSCRRNRRSSTAPPAPCATSPAWPPGRCRSPRKDRRG